MSDSYHLQTPEYVDVAYEVAGVGSRFLATLVNSALLVGAVGAVGIIALWLVTITDSTEYRSLVAAVAALIGFAIVFGYYIFFEVAWNGQSPGKKAARLRVVRLTGYPITLVDAILRNLLRLVDFLPGFYALGVVVMIANSRSRRIGDLVARTMVVKVRDVSLDMVVRSAAMVSGAPSDLFSLPHVERLTPDDLRLVRAFLERRVTLSDDRRRTLARQISDLLMEKLETREVIYDREAFLEQIAARDQRT